MTVKVLIIEDDVEMNRLLQLDLEQHGYEAYIATNGLDGLRMFHESRPNLVVLDVPQVGSFDGNIGKFYARDLFEGKGIIVQFKWDKTIPSAPVWSQAFSPDNGKTWEWNWHMTFHAVKG